MLRRRPALLVLVTAGPVLLGLALLLGWARRLDLPAGALDPRATSVVRILARDGSLLRQVLSREDGSAIWVPLSSISPQLVEATLAGEDRRFFQHRGVDVLALIRALGQNVRHGRVVSGGSTVTMQLARLLSPAPRTLTAKLREAVLACKLERTLSKQEILWHYLNRAPYGHQAFGIEAASHRYFAKPAAQLSLAEAALLSALPRSPSGYNPYHYRARLIRRQHRILELMAGERKITEEQRRRALAEPLSWEAARRPFLAPHLTERMLSSPELRRASTIRTSIDLELQQRVEAAMRATVRRLESRHVTNAAALVVENSTGEVMAYAGSVDFWDPVHGGQNDGTLARRQPGSAVKPFTYALALERGKTAASLMEDLPVHFPTDRGDYVPRNYDGTYHGPVRLRVALASSYNVPAVHAADFVGVEVLLRRLRDLGLRSLDRPAGYYGLGLTLGNGEVTLQELTAAYAMLARGGEARPLRLVLEARTPQGEALSLPRENGRRVFDRRVAYLLGHILSDPLARAPAFGSKSVLETEFPAAVKTGTSKDFRDNWTIGYTAELTVGVWVGNFDGSSMQGVSGVTGAAPLWAEIIRAANGDRQTPLPRPEGLVEREICPLSGELTGPHCGAPVSELFVAGSEPRVECSFHQQLVLDRRNRLRAGPACPEAELERRVFTVYPPVYRAWALAQGVEPPPLAGSPLCPARPEDERVSIRVPADGDRFFIDPDLRRGDQRVPLEAIVEGWPREVRWLVDGRELTRAPFPYRADWTLLPGRHRIEAVLPGGQRSGVVTVTVE